jgi:hypothetical protein
MAAAAAIPWKEILKALPAVASAAEKVWKQIAAKPKEAPIDPTADLRTQISALGARTEEIQSGMTDQARVVAQLAEQLEAVARRAARGYWFAAGALTLSVVSLLLAAFRP